MALLGNIQTKIVEFVNEALVEQYAAAALETAINMTLGKLSKMNILQTSDTANITAGDTSFAEPTDFKEEITIYLNDGTIDYAPLAPFGGGHLEYRNAIRRRVSSDVGNPCWFSNFGGEFFFLPVANVGFTANIEYYRKHPADDGTEILFNDDALEAILAGVTYHKALLAKKTEYTGLWKPEWLDQEELFRLNNPPEPSIVY